MANETLARAAAILFLLLFFVAVGRSLVDPAKGVPPELYPPAMLCFGYLFGYKLGRNGK